MAMASDIIQIGRKNSQSEQQQRLLLSPERAELHCLYARDSGDGNAILGLLLTRKLGELAAYGATLSLRHNGVNGVPDSLARKPLSRYTQALHVNRGFRAGSGCHFNFGRVESILQPSMITTEMRPCG